MDLVATCISRHLRFHFTHLCNKLIFESHLESVSGARIPGWTHVLFGRCCCFPNCSAVLLWGLQTLQCWTQPHASSTYLYIAPLLGGYWITHHHGSLKRSPITSFAVDVLVDVSQANVGCVFSLAALDRRCPCCYCFFPKLSVTITRKRYLDISFCIRSTLPTFAINQRKGCA